MSNKPSQKKEQLSNDAFHAFLDKRNRNQNKKLKQIKELVEKRNKGENLTEEQLEKIQQKPQIKEAINENENIRKMYIQALKEGAQEQLQLQQQQQTQQQQVQTQQEPQVNLQEVLRHLLQLQHVSLFVADDSRVPEGVDAHSLKVTANRIFLNKEQLSVESKVEQGVKDLENYLSSQQVKYVESVYNQVKNSTWVVKKSEPVVVVVEEPVAVQQATEKVVEEEVKQEENAQDPWGKEGENKQEKPSYKKNNRYQGKNRGERKPREQREPREPKEQQVKEQVKVEDDGFVTVTRKTEKKAEPVVKKDNKGPRQNNRGNGEKRPYTARPEGEKKEYKEGERRENRENRENKGPRQSRGGPRNNYQNNNQQREVYVPKEEANTQQ